MRTSRSGFTITELLITVALIAVLLGFLLPALGGVWSQGEMTRSMSNLKQIATWMQLYSTDNADHVLPSRFYYDPDTGYAGQVRSNPAPPTGQAHSGTWSDILQSGYSEAGYPDAGVALGETYEHDSPDRPLYDLLGESAIKNPFRSAAKNLRNASNDLQISDPLPFGPGAKETSYPGFFAANDFFASGWPGGNPSDFRWVTNGQIRFPGQSMYLVDSWAGEVIDHYGRHFDPDDRDGDGQPDTQVDFRYGSEDLCLMLFLDGHAEPQGPWQQWQDLTERQIRVARLDTRQARLDYQP